MSRSLVPTAAAAALALAAGAARAQPAPQAYVAKAGASDKFEIAEAKVAETRSHNPRVLAFARAMVRDHEKSTATVVAAAARSMGRAPPAAVLEDHQQDDLRTLRGTSPRDFDRVYLRQQAASHREALELQRHYAKDGTDPELRRAAAAIRPTVERHLAMAEALADRLN